MTKTTSKDKLRVIPFLFLTIYFLLSIIGGIYFPNWILDNMYSLAAWTAILFFISAFIISGLYITNKKLNEEEKHDLDR